MISLKNLLSPRTALELQRIWPRRVTLFALLIAIRATVSKVIRDYIWGNRYERLMDLRGLSLPVRGLIWIGFALIALMLGVLLFNEAGRAAFPLLSMMQYVPGRGTLLPVPLLPLTFFLIVVAWSFGLVGALHSHKVVRAGVVLLYLLFAAGWLNSIVMDSLSASRGGSMGGAFWGSLAAWLGVPCFFALRWRKTPRPALEFPVVFVLVASLFLLVQAQDLDSQRVLGFPILPARLEANLLTMRGLILPLLLLLGIDIADFALRTASRASRLVTRHLHPAAPALLAVPLFGWLLHDSFNQVLAYLDRTSVAETIGAYTGALMVPVLVGVVWWLVERLGRSRTSATPGDATVAETVGRYALPLILLYTALLLAASIVAYLVIALPSLHPFLSALALAASDLAGWLGQSNAVWQAVVHGGACVAALWLARRDRPALALYLGIFGVLHFWYLLTAPGRSLAVLGWRGAEPVDGWWIIAVGGLGLYWVASKRRQATWGVRLLFLLLIIALMQQGSGIGSPYSSSFGIAGIDLLVLGLAWDILTSGSWANEGTPALPRLSRIFLYIGYMLLTVLILNWALTGHDLDTFGQFTGSVAANGYERFARPMLYAIFVVIAVGGPLGFINPDQEA